MKKTTLNCTHLRYRYHNLKRQEKSQLLDELCNLYGYNRKYLLQILNHLNQKKSRRRGPPNQFDDPELIDVLKTIWLATDQMCSKRLKAAIPLWLPAYEESFGHQSNHLKDKLLKISPASRSTLKTL